MGRAPCCDKANVKKGPWSPEEDTKLKSYIEQHGTGGNWIALPQKVGLKRCGKSCRLRWLNYLRPNIRHGGFSEDEDRIICSLYVSIGSRWSIIAAQLPGRTDNDIKNYWNTRLKKKLLGKQRKNSDHHHPPGRRGKRAAAMLLDHHHINPPAPMAAANPTFLNNHISNGDNHMIIPYWSPQVSGLHPASMSSFMTTPITTSNDPNCSTLEEFGVIGFTDENPSMRNQLTVKIEGRRQTDDGDHHLHHDSNYANYVHHHRDENDQQLMMNLHHHLPFVTDDPHVNNDHMRAISSSSSAMENMMMMMMMNSNNYGSCLEELGQSIMVEGGSNSNNTANPSTCTTATITTTTPIATTVNTRSSGDSTFPVELEQLMTNNLENSYNSNLELLDWNEMMKLNNNNNRSSTETSCGDESIESWGEMSSLISLPFPPPPPMQISSSGSGG